MYNGIGLPTPRGSGTNGYVSKNLATVYKAKEKGFKSPIEIATPTLKKPNTEIIEHDRKRKIEVKCVEFQQMLEDQGYSHDEITRRVTKYRNSLLGEKNATELRDENGRIIVKDTHEIAEAQQRKNDKLREAFGISEYFVDGSSFDSERRAKEAATKAALEATKKYTWIPSPPSSGDEVEKPEMLPESSPKSKKRSKKSSSPSEEIKKKKKKKHKRRSRSTTTKEEKAHRRDKKSKHTETKGKKKSKTNSPARSKSKKSKKDRSSSEESYHKKRKASPTESVRRQEAKQSKYKDEKKRKQKDASPRSEHSYRHRRELSPTEGRRKHDHSPEEERRKRDVSPLESRSRKRELSPGEERSRKRYRSSSGERRQRKYDKDEYKKGSPSRRPKSRRSASVDEVEVRRSPAKRRRSPSVDYNDRKRRRRSVSITRKDSHRSKYEKKSKFIESSKESDRYLSDEKNSKKLKSKLVVRRRASDVKEIRRNYEYDQYSSDDAKKSKYSNRRKDKYEEDKYDEKKKPKSSYFDKSKKSSRIDEIEKKISCRYSVEISDEERYNSPNKNEDPKLKKNDKINDLSSVEKRKPVEEAKKLDTKKVTRISDSYTAENGVVKNDKVNRDGSTSSSLSYSPMEKYPHRYLDILGDMPRKTSKTVVENVHKLNSNADCQNVAKKDDRLKRETEFLNKFKSGIAEKVNSEKISPKKLPIEENKLQSVTDTLPISLKDVPLPPEVPAGKVSTGSSESINKKEEKKSEVNVSNKICTVNGNDKIKDSKNTSLNAKIAEKILLLKKTLLKQNRDSDSSSSADESKSPGKQSRSESVSSSSSDSSRSSRSSSSSSSSSDSDHHHSRSSRRSRRSRSGSDESSDSENSRSYSSSDSSRSRSESDSSKRNRKKNRKSRSGSDSRSDSDSYTSHTSRSRSISIPRRKGSPSFLERRRITSKRRSTSSSSSSTSSSSSDSSSAVSTTSSSSSYHR